jgi:hypothetical protein
VGVTGGIVFLASDERRFTGQVTWLLRILYGQPGFIPVWVAPGLGIRG